MKYKQLRTRILLIIISVTILLLTFVNIYDYYDRKEILYRVSIEKLLILSKVIRNFEKEQFTHYKARTKWIENKNQLLDAIHTQDKTYLTSTLDAMFSIFKQETPKLIHMHVYTTNAMLLYAHKPKEAKELIHAKTNKVLKEALKEKKIVKGYVVLQNKTFFYSIVCPLKKDGKIIAYIEYGIQADNIFKIASKAGRYKYALYLYNKHSKDLNTPLGTPVASNSSIFKNIHITQNFIYEYANKNKIIKYKDKYYLFHQYDIETKFQKNFAQVVMASNITKYIQDNKNKMFMTIALSLLILSITYLSLYLSLTKLINKLIKDENELVIQQEQMQIVIDNNDSLIVMLQKDELILANKTFLSFFNYNSLKDFCNKHNSIAELFIDDANLFTSSQNISNSEWIKQLNGLEDKQKVIGFKNNKYGIHYFNVQISSVAHESDSYVVVFTNITNIFKQSQKDQYMARHDTLTGILNRQSFNEAIKSDISEQLTHPHNSSLLMFDLDFFKRVNDTYGHQVGDEVLIQFTKIISNHIRSNDIFARWGGEEFVLLLIGISEDVAYKIANSLKNYISNAEFSDVGHITCSVGLSSYKTDDTMQEWLKRVDEALYKAKENGRDRVELL